MISYIFHHKLKTLVLLLVNGLSIFLTTAIIPAVSITNFWQAVITAFFLGLMNALLRPLLLKFALKFSLVFFGVWVFLLNTFVILVTSWLFHTITFPSFWAALLFSLVLSCISTFINYLFSVDDRSSFYYEVLRKLANKKAIKFKPGKIGTVIIQIDGLAAPILEEELRNNKLPTINRWLNEKSHIFGQWECDLPSMTSASQSGIMYGHHQNIPAFRWYDKSLGKLMVSNHPKDAMVIDSFISKGKKGLLSGGSSFDNIFKGGAEHNVLVMSDLFDIKGNRKAKNEDFQGFLLHPYNLSRGVALMIWEIIIEYWEAFLQRQKNVQPRMDRGGVYPLLRAATCVLLREVTTYLLLEGMHQSRPILYADYLGYDEVAHHSGPKTEDARKVLRKLDKTLAFLEKISKETKRKYQFVLISDHGQSSGPTFKDIYGKTLQELIQDLMKIKGQVTTMSGGSEGAGQVGIFLTEVSQQDNFVGKVSTNAFKGNLNDGYVNLESKKIAENLAEPEVAVCASGNLAQVYFTKIPGRLSLEQINKFYPKLVKGLTNCKGIGFLLIKSEKHGPIVLGKDGQIRLTDGKIIGKNPLSPFPESTTHSLETISTYSNCGDILINSSYDPKKDEVYAFEELIGCHGGSGGLQTSPFIIYPTNWGKKVPVIYGSGQIYKFLWKHAR